MDVIDLQREIMLCETLAQRGRMILELNDKLSALKSENKEKDKMPE